MLVRCLDHVGEVLPGGFARPSPCLCSGHVSLCLRHSPAVRLPAGPRVPLVRFDPSPAETHRHIRGVREPQAQSSKQQAAKLCRELGLADEAHFWNP